MYFVNEAFNAGLPFTNAGTTNSLKDGQQIRPVDRKWDYGATIGGPIDIPKLYDGKNKSFFFFNFERYQQTKASPMSKQFPQRPTGWEFLQRRELPLSNRNGCTGPLDVLERSL